MEDRRAYIFTECRGSLAYPRRLLCYLRTSFIHRELLPCLNPHIKKDVESQAESRDDGTTFLSPVVKPLTFIYLKRLQDQRSLTSFCLINEDKTFRKLNSKDSSLSIRLYLLHTVKSLHLYLYLIKTKAWEPR